MRRKFYAPLIVVCCIWYSCSKSSVKPQIINNTTTNVPPAAPYTASGPVNLTGAHDITISGKSINGGSAPAISLYNCYNVHITQNALGNSTDVGIYLYQCHNITVDYNYINHVSTGVYVDHSSGDSIIVNYNQFLNMQGPYPRGQIVQFNTVSGAGNSISHNRAENIAGQSSTQDEINLYQSNGTASSPIVVIGNWMRGGGPGSASGGIMLGDSGGSYETASNNILVDPGQMGLSISGGDHVTLINNTVYSQSLSFTNVGIVVWGQAGYTISNATVSGNHVKFINSEGVENDAWLGPGESAPTGWNTNVWDAGIGASVLPAALISPTAATSQIQAASSM